jgi:hypothetical protein
VQVVPLPVSLLDDTVGLTRIDDSDVTIVLTGGEIVGEIVEL